MNADERRCGGFDRALKKGQGDGEMSLMTLGCVGFVLTITASGVSGQVETFVNDFEGWAEAIGPFSTIDFETLPDGSPSDSSVEINALFNYTSQGATFSSPFDDLIIVGNSSSGFGLRAINGTVEDPTYIRADLETPALSVGYFFAGNTIFDVFDEEGELLWSEFIDSSGTGLFMGINSDVPIAYVFMDEGTSANIESFHFASVPEPGTVGVLGLGAAWVLRRRRKFGHCKWWRFGNRR